MLASSAPGSLLGIEPLDIKDIDGMLEAAYRMQKRRPRPLFKEKRVALLFYES